MRYVSEIFGFPPTNKTIEATKIRSKYLCPFRGNGSDTDCDPINKKSNLTDDKGNFLLSHQTGACSTFHGGTGKQTGEAVIICPYRFQEKNTKGKVIVFDFIKDKFFKGKNLLFVPEIGLGKYGRADWIICEFNDTTQKIIDYSHLEFQADATTGTGGLVLCIKDFFDGKDITQNTYEYGLNSKASIKGSSLQMIDKGYLFQKLGKKSLWVIQDTLFDILCKIYGVIMKDVDKENDLKTNNLIFVVVGLDHNVSNDRYNLVIRKCVCTSPSALQKAMSKKEPIEESLILEALNEKIESGNFLRT
ncbi:MAG: hypothetical protein M1580_01130 [Candidatus Parvarchaeota archaeon]|nr:hypothetical protein [Candidatus Parvarchaeota archaeon]